MSPNEQKEEWVLYRKRELELTTPLLKELGFVLEEEQVHTSGERYLMSGHKLVLVGKRTSDGKRVIIKVSSGKDGIAEIEHERLCRQTLQKLNFRGQTLLSPEELLHVRKKGVVIVVSEYIEQENPFLSRPIKEQFSLALRSFKMQESVHAATYSHAKTIRNIFGLWNVSDYLHTFATFKKDALQHNDKLTRVMEQAYDFLHAHKPDIERYTGFLTHEDFALHNLRIKGDDIYLIDHSSLRFGNKHESWARFMNFMLLYNHPLEKALISYVHDNRSPEENESLKLMRIYKTGQLISYYAKASSNSSDDLLTLSQKRIEFWTNVLESLLEDKPVPEHIIKEYKDIRDELRSDEERKRQRELQQLT